LSHHELHYDERIREQGYRLTPQRETIMDALCAIGDHASVNQVYERVHQNSPAIDRATVYRTLHFFHDLQLVTASEIDGETVYEVAGRAAHHHLICRFCGAEQTLHDRDLQGLVSHLQETYGFTAELRHLVIPGLCQECRCSEDSGQ
jgi:Fur family transcriptional regulator, ferric uptake regulator